MTAPNVALDDALCLVRVTTLLDRYRKPYRIRAERSTSFADLRVTHSVLIGAVDNPWTLRSARAFRVGGTHYCYGLYEPALVT